jgi:hypothetical protein
MEIGKETGGAMEVDEPTDSSSVVLRSKHLVSTEAEVFLLNFSKFFLINYKMIFQVHFLQMLI